MLQYWYYTSIAAGCFILSYPFHWLKFLISHIRWLFLSNLSEGGPVDIFKCGSRKEKYLGSNDIIGSAKGSQISETYWGEVGKGERVDVYLEVRKRRGHIFFEWNKCLCPFSLIHVCTASVRPYFEIMIIKENVVIYFPIVSCVTTVMWVRRRLKCEKFIDDDGRSDDSGSHDPLCPVSWKCHGKISKHEMNTTIWYVENTLFHSQCYFDYLIEIIKTS